MKRLPPILITILLSTLCLNGYCQKSNDQIFNKDGTTVAAKVIEITSTEVKYKKASNVNGPTYSILKGDIIKIIYANGEEEKFTKAQGPPKEETPFASDNFLTFSDDGNFIVTDATLPDQKVYLCYWNPDMELQSKRPYENWQTSEGIYYWQVVSNDGSYLSSSSLYNKEGNQVVEFVNPITKKPFTANHVGVISPNGQRIVMKAFEGALLADYGNGSEWILTFDNKGTLLAKTKIKVKAGGVTAIKFSHNSAYYLVAHFDKITLYDADGKQMSEIPLQTPWVDKDEPYNKYGDYNNKAFINFSFDDQRIISPNSEDYVAIWDVNGNLIANLYHFKAQQAAISRDGKMAVTVGSLPYGKTVKHKNESGVSEESAGGKIKIWSMEGKLIKEISFPVNPSSIEFTPDNAGIVLVVDGVSIWLWADEDYKLPDGADAQLTELAKYHKDEKEAERKADNARKWGAFGKGLVVGLDKANKNWGKEMKKREKQEKYIDDVVNSANKKNQTTTSRKGKRLEIVIINKTTKKIESVLISPKESRDWSQDIMGESLLNDGQNAVLVIPANYGTTCSFDLQVIYPDGKTTTWPNLDFCKYYRFELSPNSVVQVFEN